MNSNSDLWNEILKLLSRDLSDTAIATWFGDCRVLEVQENLLLLHCPSEYSRDIILGRYADLLKKALKEIFGADFELSILTTEEMEQYLEKHRSPAADPFGSEEFTFDKFIVGPSNKLAYAAAKAVGENQVKDYNPLLIYGDSGLGKTHLIYSIAHALRHSNPKSRIVYIKGDDFTNELIAAIQTGHNREFREKYRLADLLLVDDVQFIAGKVQTQEEFFHTFNTLYESGRQIVLTSDRPPKEMLRLEDRLRSRFEAGLLADIQPPDYETRVAIVKTKAARLGIPLAEDAGKYIAENIKANIRQIEGILKKIRAYIDLQGVGAVNMELVQRITKEIIDSEKAYAPEFIIGKVADFYGISSEEVIGKGKTKDVANARQISTYLIRKLTGQTLEQIGEVMGRDHTTVLHSIRKVEENLQNDPKLVDAVHDITANITNK
ncbi:MAG: chromosomal replication initiator protein DnaA [Oscillospiraceae bacterium]|nr:chromosomal replication initiator protein DnaA [Oscillospiraceae bacterium]